MSNSSAQKRARHQGFLLDALPPPSSPTRPGSPILLGSRSEGSLAAENGTPLWTGEESAIRRASFTYHLATNARLTDSMECRPGDIHRYAP